ncbi:MAG TPA: hypothetical protein VJK72_02655 [Candidatus Nanoarchaeia archaeon]|nr:hypothetical protein [Candidatus Nanoarchaeia archaeon]
MDKDALMRFKVIFDSHNTRGREEIVLRKGGILTLSARGSDITARISLARGTSFFVEKVGNLVELWVIKAVQLEELKIYLSKGKYKMAPNGWIISTNNGNFATLAIL